MPGRLDVGRIIAEVIQESLALKRELDEKVEVLSVSRKRKRGMSNETSKAAYSISSSSSSSGFSTSVAQKPET